MPSASPSPRSRILPRPDTESFGFIGTRRLDTQLVAGRQADPDQPDEFVADRSFVAQHHAHLGDRFPVTFWTWDQVMRGEGYVKPPTGPEIEAVLVGILQAPASLEENAASVIFSPALLKEDIGLGQTIMSVDLDQGTTLADLHASVDSLPDGSQMKVEAATVISREIRTAVDAQARGTWLMALVAGLAAVVALGQLLSRHVRLAPVDRQPLETLGFTERQLALEAVCRAAIPAIAGVMAGVPRPPVRCRPRPRRVSRPPRCRRSGARSSDRASSDRRSLRHSCS